ncbi:T9SS type A sorting domain-containing protein [candidate division WOR-3 bacterium]|nr:T9SS type A sorting domain-containing protein [candidate division WOR-3 bacterium]
MKLVGLLIVTILLMNIGFLSGNYPLQNTDILLPTVGAESGYIIENPPPIDSICLVFPGVDYGDQASSPQNYVNAKHITNVMVGSYYFPVVIWETGSAWGSQSLFSYWDDMFNFWSYPDSFTSNNGIDTGRPAICSDSKGNLHFCWHQGGSPDGYEIFYTRALLDTSAGVIQYNVERPAQFISETNGEEEQFPAMTIYGDTLIMVVFNVGSIQSEKAIGYNYSTDGGNTWVGRDIVYDHGGIIPGSWQLLSIGTDPNTEDMWVASNFDMSGDGSMDILAHHWAAATNTWSTETVANATSMHPYAIPALVVDYSSTPHIIFQENHSNTGGLTGLTVFYASGPFGQLYYTYRLGANNWLAPMKIMLPLNTARNYCSGHPSAGIATDNTVYFSTTLPESASAVDTSAYGNFNVHYAEISPYTGALSYGGQVSSIPPSNDSTNTIYPHITYYVPLGSQVPAGMHGPGITWCQMVNNFQPADVYYTHPDTLVPVEETKTISSSSPIKLYQNYPNPAREKTMIRFTVPNNTNISLNIYDISGRLVKTLANGIPGAGSYFVVWDGKNEEGKEVPGGVYLYTMRAGAYKETRKLLLIH